MPAAAQCGASCTCASCTGCLSQPMLRHHTSSGHMYHLAVSQALTSVVLLNMQVFSNAPSAKGKVFSFVCFLVLTGVQPA